MGLETVEGGGAPLHHLPPSLPPFLYRGGTDIGGGGVGRLLCLQFDWDIVGCCLVVSVCSNVWTFSGMCMSVAWADRFFTMHCELLPPTPTLFSPTSPSSHLIFLFVFACIVHLCVLHAYYLCLLSLYPPLATTCFPSLRPRLPATALPPDKNNV